LQETLVNLRQAQVNTRIMCAVLLDTKGPEIRTGALKGGGPVTYESGSQVTLTTDYSAEGDSKLIAISYQKLAQDVFPGNQILIADGSLVLVVTSCDKAHGTVQARCTNTATIGERKNCNLPGVVVDLPTITEKDTDDLLSWGVANQVDFVAASFVRKGSDVTAIRRVLGKAGENIKIISKVENQEGLVNFDDILHESDGIMVARGDLGMEIPTEKIFLAQKLMISKCNRAGKPVVTATQMLESMIKNPRPTRAEATDVANAVLDGTDCVMLSGETAAGSFPVEAVKVMVKICREAESSLDYFALFKSVMKNSPIPMTPLESLASSAVRTAHKVRAALIVVLTRGGSTARLVSKYRPSVPILTVAVPVLTTDSLTWTCSGEAPARHALLTRGLIPLLAEGSARATDTDTTDEILTAAIEHAKESGYCRLVRQALLADLRSNADNAVAQGDAVVALHRIGSASVVKIVSCQ
jgi:pyruvate kinase